MERGWFGVRGGLSQALLVAALSSTRRPLGHPKSHCAARKFDIQMGTLAFRDPQVLSGFLRQGESSPRVHWARATER